ncbi:MAG: RNase J family beta-CASP ribonuclease [Clostridia bacterium]|nr:RNase J family beta-CASP ribonuclease [Clostridia bacterium]
MTNEVKTNETQESGLPRRQNRRTNEKTARSSSERRESKTSNYRPRRRDTNVREQAPREKRVKQESTKTVEKVIEEMKETRRTARNTGAETRNTRTQSRTPRETRSSDRTTDRATRTRTRNTKTNHQDIIKFNFKKSNLKIIPLGGLEEIGKNITVFEYEDEIILVDCGLEFPEDDMLGVDLVIPDITYLIKNQEKIKGLVITHGHEDHIGSIPYILKQINMPIYATKLTVALINNKLEEHHLKRSTKMHIVEQGQTINFGKMQVEFIRSNHSIPDAVMLAINTPVGTVLHTGDFKIDYTPIDDKVVDLGRIAELGNKGILALLSDSTNSERKGFTMSESSVGEVFDKLFLNNSKRIVVATFASNVHRVQQIVNSAIKYGRKIAVCGRSMQNMIEAARGLGYIKDADSVFIDIDNIKNYRDDQLVIITTGSQGETMSALTRMANGEHKKVTITPNDMVIISATPIPGNEKLVSKVIDDLMKIGAEVIYSSLEDVHVSGHACQEEQKLILTLAKPKYFIPVHGEYRQLIAHAETAKKMGVEGRNIFLMNNGRTLELNEYEGKLTTSVPNGKVLVDGLGVGDVGNIVLRDRQHLSQDGLIIIVVGMDSNTGEIVSGPDVVSRGFVYVRESENLMDDLKRVIRDEVRKLEENHVSDWSTIKSTLKDDLRDYIFEKTKRNPMILPIIMDV